MKLRKTLIAAAVVALIPLGTAAIAGDNDYGSKDKAGAGASFKKLDANKDGRISQAEAAADTTIVFSSADTNGDGYLDNDEWKAAQKGSSEPQPQSMPSQGTPPESSTPPETTAPDSTVTPGSQPPDTETPRQ